MTIKMPLNQQTYSSCFLDKRNCPMLTFVTNIIVPKLTLWYKSLSYLLKFLDSNWNTSVVSLWNCFDRTPKGRNIHSFIAVKDRPGPWSTIKFLTFFSLRIDVDIHSVYVGLPCRNQTEGSELSGNVQVRL